MSLYKAAMEPFVLKVISPASDGYGSFASQWTDGGQFSAAAVYSTSVEERIGGVQKLRNIYDITTPRAVTLRHDDVVQRLSDGKAFRVTSNGDDKKTPRSAWLDMRVVTAVEWELPDG